MGGVVSTGGLAAEVMCHECHANVPSLWLDDHLRYHTTSWASISIVNEGLKDRVARLEKLMIALLADGKVDVSDLEELL